MCIVLKGFALVDIRKKERKKEKRAYNELLLQLFPQDFDGERERLKSSSHLPYKLV